MKPHAPFQPWKALPAIALSIGVGYVVVRIFAAGPAGSFLLSGATVAGKAAVVTNAAALGGKMVQFGATATPTPTPTPTPTHTPTPTPAPTPTATPGTQTNCAAHPSQCGYPDATNTGVPAGTALTVINGNVTISTAGTIYDGKDIRGCVSVSAPGVIIRRSKITCSGYYGIITSGSAATNGAARLLVEDVEMVLGGNTTGMASDNITARRVYSHGGENGFDLGSNMTVENSYITGIVEVNGGHGDGIQVSSPASNLLVNHNSILMNTNVTSAVNWTDQTVSMTVQNNLLVGGGYTLYCPRVSVPSGAFKALNNRFGNFGFGSTDSCGNSGQVFTGNYKDSNLSQVN